MHGPQSLFTSIVTAYSADLYRFAYWLSHDRTDAEDLVQETFARAWRAIEQLRDPSAARAWLFSTLRREHARQYERLRPEIDDVEVDDIAGDFAGIDNRPEAHALRSAIKRLPRSYREPLLLQVLGGFSGEEIAQMLDLSTTAVMVRIFRARTKLRLHLGGRDELDGMAEL
jgi:RNA polymerase sigma-70 factor (ECF subfamily)